MKRLILLFGLIISFVAVNAQNATITPQEQAHNQALKLQKYVGLSADQTTKVEQVFLDRILAIQKIQGNTSETPEQQKKDIEAVRSEKDNELSTILTADQYAQYQQLKARRGQDAAQGGQGQ